MGIKKDRLWWCNEIHQYFVSRGTWFESSPQTVILRFILIYEDKQCMECLVAGFDIQVFEVSDSTTIK